MFREYKKIFVYGLIIVVAFFLFFYSQKVFVPFKLKVSSSSIKLIRILSIPFRELKKILYYHRTFDEYVRLRRQSDSLKTRLVGLEEVIRENTRFQELLEFKGTLVYSSILANVVGRDPTNWNASIIIDKGLDAGVAEGMPVVTSAGVVGKISEVGSESSRVILLNDPQFSVVALVQEAREIGLLSGTLQGNCRLRYLPKDAKVRVGDKVITSKQSSNFPDGLLIGEVVGVDRKKRDFEIEYIIEPAISLSKIEEVLIIQK